jgi:hypothetical protein
LREFEARRLVKSSLHDFAEKWSQTFREFGHALGEILYGMSVYEMVRDLQKERGKLERLFILLVFGDLLGVPVLPPFYSMRLIPYVVPHLGTWRRSMLRERDLTDLFEQEIG